MRTVPRRPPLSCWAGGLLLALLVPIATALAFYPHGSATGMGCESCHVPWSGVGDYWLPPDIIHTPVDADDTQFNSLCWSCHNDVIAPYVETHSSLSTDDRHGEWNMECRDCHWPHLDPQYGAYGESSTLEEAIVTSLDDHSVTVSGAGWSPGEHAGCLLIPNVAEPFQSYKIYNNTADTLQVHGTINLNHVAVGNTLAILYGKSIRAEIETPSSGTHPVRLFEATGADSFADGDATYDGICETCHTQTSFHRNDDGGDHGHHAGEKCTGCHLHTSGFGVGGSHGVHGSDIQGPAIACGASDLGCHGSETPPVFADGEILEQTGACTHCHSLDGTAGAKAYWSDDGSSEPIPSPGSWAATEGDESFCGSCHDDTPGNTAADGLGSPAPNVMGDGSSYGYAVTGHGKSTGAYARLAFQTAAETGNPAADRECRDCHDPQSQHFGVTDQRLRSGFENDQDNSTCSQCHEPAGLADSPPHLYTSSAEYEAAAHGGSLCTDCHEVHGLAAGAPPGMARESIRTLCFSCHNDAPPNPPSAPTEPPADHNASSTTPCSGCHNPHAPIHGAGSSGANCIECHGHDAGTAYDPDRTEPYAPGAATSGGNGTVQSHSAHTETDADDVRGPGIYCDRCHDITNFPAFASGTDANLDGRVDLSETDVCDPCHSPGGSYDGVSDPVVGAKVRWSAGVYSGDLLPAGLERWCATCHDELPSVIGAVGAPNVVGNEGGSYSYGTGWGYYRTGHGLPFVQSYPASGGVSAGADLPCDACHDNTVPHVDGLDRTFACADGCTPAEYRQGYRLALVGGEDPMQIPLPQNTTPLNGVGQYRLCYGCHDSGPYLDGANPNTNLKTDGVNRHQYHLSLNQLRYSADYDYGGTYNSRITCVNCHNVHGSTRLAMVRDGALIGRGPGLRIWYYNPALVAFSASSANPPDPENLPLAASTGTVWSGGSSSNLCTHCHGNLNLVAESRIPFQDTDVVPVLAWTAEANFTTDGVHPDQASGGNSFEFRVQYTDGDGDPPLSIQVLVDRNDDGDFGDAGDAAALVETDPGDTNHTDGKIYHTTLTLQKAGDGVLAYRFAAADADGSAVSGAPVSDHTLVVTNAVPTLGWTGQVGYETDGVAPNSGPSGSTFEFRVTYTDLDDEAPSSVQLFIDRNDDGDHGDAGEIAAMGPYDADPTYSDGRVYAYTTALDLAGDGHLSFRFAASDSTDVAVGAPAAGDGTVSVTSASNTPPVLSWTGEEGYTVDGAEPDADAGGRPFSFRVSYSDADGDAPAAVEVWVDADDSGIYDPGEAHTMDEVDPADTDFSDGKRYEKRLYVDHPGTANKVEALDYRFYSRDAQGAEATLGDPVADHSFSVQDAIEVPGEVATITAAIASAVAGDMVLVAPGSFGELVDFNGKDDIVLLATDDPAGPNATTLTGKITAGNQNGGADNVTISGFRVTSTQARILDFNASTAAVDDCLFTSNSGNAVFVNGIEKVTIRNSTFEDNTATSVYLTMSGGYVDILDSTFRNNSGGNGGAVYSNSGGHWNIARSTFDGNTAINGGAFYGISPLGTIDDCVFVNNTGRNSADGTGGGGALYLTSAATNLAVTDTFIQGNSAGTAGGGAIYVENGSRVDLTNVLIAGNETTGNGGAVHEKGYANYLFCTLSGNRAVDGGGIYHLNSNTTTVRNSILYNNDATAGIYDQITTNYRWSYVDVYNTLINQTPGNGSGNERLSYEDMGGNITGQDPLFAGALPAASAPTAGGDYRLVSGSPAVDSADGGFPSDHDAYGGSRPLGGGYDMGAHEAE